MRVCAGSDKPIHGVLLLASAAVAARNEECTTFISASPRARAAHSQRAPKETHLSSTRSKTRFGSRSKHPMRLCNVRTTSATEELLSAAPEPQLLSTVSTFAYPSDS